MFHISGRVVLLNARSPGFDYRLRSHSGVTENILRLFQLIANSFHVVIHEPRRHTASTRSKGGHPMFGRSVCQLGADKMTNTTCWSCVWIRRVSWWTKPPSSPRNVFLFLCHPVLALDDEVRTLQQDLRKQPSSRHPRFNTLSECLLVLRRDARMRMPLTTSRTLHAQ